MIEGQAGMARSSGFAKLCQNFQYKFSFIEKFLSLV